MSDSRKEHRKSLQRYGWIFALITALVFFWAVFFVLKLSVAAGEQPSVEEIHSTSHASLSNMEGQAVHALSPGVDIVVTKSHAQRFFVGNVGTYNITVQNIGDADLTSPLVLTDVLPTGLSYASCSGDGWVCSAGTWLTLTRASGLGIGTSSSLMLNVTPSSQIKSSQFVTNTVATIVGFSDDDLTNNQDVDVTDVSADLEVTKTVTPTTADTNNIVTYTLTVKNNGPNDTTGVVLTDTLPTSHLTYSNHTQTAGSYSSTTGRWQIGTLAADASATLTIIAAVKDGVCAANVVNATEGLSSDLYDSNASNDQANASLSVRNTCVTGKVVNTSSAALPNVSMLLVDSIGHRYATSTNVNGYYTFTNSTSQPIVGGLSTVTASATGYRSSTQNLSITQGNRHDLNFTLTPIGELKLLKTNGRDYIVPGQTFTYTIPITNVGALQATDLIITDSISNQLTFITYTLRDKVNNKVPFSSIGFANLGSVYTWTLPTSLNLAPSERITLTVRVRVIDPLSSGTNSVANTARVRYFEDASTLNNKSASDADYTPNFSITQSSVSPTEAKVNERFTFSFVVYNNHPTVQATNVVFTNTFPSYLTYYSSSPSGGSFNSSSHVFTINLGTINASSSKTVTVVMTVGSAASSTQILNNVGTARFLHGDIYQWRQSNTVQYRILGTSTLPGTGFAPVKDESPEKPAVFYLVFFLALLIIALGAGGIILSFVIKADWASWSRQMNGLVLFVGILFLIYASILGGYWEPGDVAGNSKPTGTEISGGNPLPAGIETTNLNTFQSYDSLPNYPIPTPTSLPETVEGKPPDDSPPTRIMIPALGLDTIVKYVPYDGYTWLISGLQNEIAWMGSTSWPGLGGNTALAGHVTLRNGADGPFRYLENLQPNDRITVYTEKNIYHYRVRSKFEVSDDDMSVVQPSEQPILTLITCTGWNRELGHYLKRLIIVADLEQSVPIVNQGGSVGGLYPH